MKIKRNRRRFIVVIDIGVFIYKFKINMYNMIKMIKEEIEILYRELEKVKK